MCFPKITNLWYRGLHPRKLKCYQGSKMCPRLWRFFLLRTRAIYRKLFLAAALAVLSLLLFTSCLPKPPSETGGINITLYGFSIMKESLEKAIYPGFAAKWKREQGQDVRFTSSFAGS